MKLAYAGTMPVHGYVNIYSCIQPPLCFETFLDSFQACLHRLAFCTYPRTAFQLTTALLRWHSPYNTTCTAYPETWIANHIRVEHQKPVKRTSCRGSCGGTRTECNSAMSGWATPLRGRAKYPYPLRPRQFFQHKYFRSPSRTETILKCLWL